MKELKKVSEEWHVPWYIQKKKKFKNVHKRVIKLKGVKEKKAYTSNNSRGTFRENPAKHQVFS